MKRKEMNWMKKKYLFILVLAVIVISAAALSVLNGYRLGIDESEIVCVSFYEFYDEGELNKKVITNTGDIRTIVNAMNSLHSRGKFDVNDVPAGGIGFHLVFDLGNAARLISCNQTDHNGHGFLCDGDIRIKVSGLNLEALWNSLDYEKIEAKPAELFSD